MRLILAFVSISLLGAGITRAKEGQTELQILLVEAARTAQQCTYQTEGASVNAAGEATSMWGPTKIGADALAKIAQGDPAFLDAMKVLKGSVTAHQTSGTRRTEAVADGDLPRFWVIFKIRELWFTLEERFVDDQWVPTEFQTRVKLDIGFGPLAKGIRRGYRVLHFGCDTS